MNSPCEGGDIFDQGPVPGLHEGDQIVIRQSNGREMFLPISVLLGHINHAVGCARVPVERIEGLAAVATSGSWNDLRDVPEKD